MKLLLLGTVLFSSGLVLGILIIAFLTPPPKPPAWRSRPFDGEDCTRDNDLHEPTCRRHSLGNDDANAS
jgi:hypothetical protein